MVSKGAGLCSYLAPSDCHQNHETKQQLGSVRHSFPISLRMCSVATTGAALQVGTSPRGSCQWDSCHTEFSLSSRIGAMQGVAGVEAETSDEVDSRRTTGIRVGQVNVQGFRDEMEDDAVVCEGPLGFTFAAVFDGHVGYAAVQFLRDELYKECVECLEGGKLLESDSSDAVEEALVRAFQQADRRLLSWLESNTEEKESGATATVVFLRSNSLTIAHVGDSRAVLSVGGKAVDLCQDHRPFGISKKSVEEINRVKEAGGWISHGRLCATLSISRAFGDVGFKTKKEEMLEEGIKARRWTKSFTQKLNLDGDWLSVTPDVAQVQLDEDAEFVVLASDGLWDSFKSKDAVRFIRDQLKEHGNPQRAAEAIAQATLERHGQDNISVVILDLGKVLQEEPGIKFKLW